MKRIDDSTLEAIAELICGSGAGGASNYDSPGPYRSMGEIRAFFHRARVTPKGQSATRKWFVLESLEDLNGTIALENVLLRLASPKEYRGDGNMTKQVERHLNEVLQVEGLEVTFHGVDPQLRERKPSAAVAKSKETMVEVPPDFHRLVQDELLADVLSFRWNEAQKCVQVGAYLAAIVMMGSILEGLLLNRVEHNREVANRTRSSPKDQKTGQPRPIQEWGLSTLIDVAHEARWLQGDVKRFSHALRESRNLVHPYVQRLNNETPDHDTCSICWRVVQAAVSDLLGID